ncbi:Hypothetical_protein [Hexamita inflata]|uniref:Hypothetical_protein n=1 Tax=Hexamita inflata TaxID=28002 RepID=A0AA86NNQ6_9EUKA|nr:Hypothetical protein HINF_LOCUS9983 [Hexamita inflata]
MICVLRLIYYSGFRQEQLYLMNTFEFFQHHRGHQKLIQFRDVSKVQRAFLFDAYYFCVSQRQGHENCWYSRYCIKEHTNYFMDIASFIFHLTVFKYESRNNIDKFVELIVITQ